MNIYQLLYNIYRVSMAGSLSRIRNAPAATRRYWAHPRTQAARPPTYTYPVVRYVIPSALVESMRYRHLTQLSNFRLPIENPKMNTSSLMTAMGGKASFLAALAFSAASIRISVPKHSKNPRRS
jgi:hypothetical protein